MWDMILKGMKDIISWDKSWNIGNGKGKMKYEENFCRRIKEAKNNWYNILKSWVTDTEVGIISLLYSRFHFCVSHRRKMKAIRRSLKKYLEKKLEKLMGIMDEKERSFGVRK